ncbi:hypothetical protein HELRODRAFT_77531 [Helobdella robusta]|uniref:ABC transporter domain-containing protein n=1 Tax=Helobdella robusta TaxID=6412 RepID=T1G2Z4_HELRO|nr:hypothetical protein HELRODRAFT_77531 [Helobdella robusta]ESO05674.1 hypothetical protein HELRODRAFT_77531 [Helobdella robusta]
MFKVDENKNKLLSEVFNISQEAFCNEFFGVFKIVKPLFVGKIFYTAENQDVIDIINEANKSYHILLHTKKFLANLDSISSTFFNTFNDKNNVVVKELKLLGPFLKFFGNSFLFDFVPTTPTSYYVLKSKLRLASLVMNCLAEDRFQQVENEYLLKKRAVPFINNKTFLTGLVFDLKKSSNNSIPFLSYKIMVDHYFIKLLNKFNMRESTEFTIFHLNPRIVPAFIQSGFVYIQDIIDHAFIKWYTGVDNIGTTLQQFPTPCHVEDIFQIVHSLLLPLFMVISWLTFVPIIVKDIVIEKELKLSEFMKIMGLSNSVHWLAWFIHYFIITMFPVLMTTILVKIGNLLIHSSSSLYTVFMMIYMAALITQCFMFSVFFNHSNTGAAFSTIFYFISFLPYKFCINFQYSMNIHYKIIASLSYTSAFGFGCSYMAKYEDLEEGLQWSNMFKSPDEADQFNFGYCMLMMIVDIILHVVITLYVERVHPGNYGVAKPWYFPIDWVVNICQLKRFSNRTKAPTINQMNVITEPLTTNLDTGVSTVNLVKKFKKFVAVNNLNAEFYKNHVTGFLGHNGAGKTTTLSIITGLYGPSSGTVYVNNMDIKTQIKEIRKIISLCPQHNILYDDLTVMEHLLFYSMLKGLPKKEIKSECNRILMDLNLFDKRDVNSSYLSGGMKRKLSVGIAYIGSPDVVVLDEPTAGVDAYARRSIWDLIQKYKKNRTTILSTHLMDEADILSDRLIIINKGQVRASGSIMFLKKHFGKGYHLDISFDKNFNDEIERQKAVDNFEKLLKQFFPNASLEISVHGYGISCILPFAHNDIFHQFFNDLHSKKKELRFSNYGLSNITLERVFTEANKNINSKDKMSVEQSFNYNFNVCPPFKTLKNLNLVFNQSSALFAKRLYILRRSFKLMFCQLILPPIFLLLMLLLTDYGFKISSDISDMELHPWLTKSKDSNLVVFLSRNKNLHWDVKPVENSLLNEPWMGNKCLDPAVHTLTDEKCDIKTLKTNLSLFRSMKNPRFNVSCSCTSGYKRCFDQFSGKPPPELKLINGDVFQNLTNYNIQKYLVDTQHNFSETRFAGIEFRSRGSLHFSFSEKLLNITKSLISLSDQTLRGLDIFNVSNVSRALMKNIETIAPKFITNHLATVWFSHESPVSVVAYTNVLHNALLRSHSKDVSHKKLGLSVHLQSISRKSKKSIVNKALEVFPPVTILFSLTIIPTSFLFFLLNEKNSGLIHLQFISGVNSTLYWLTNFIWDLSTFLLLSAVFLIEFVIFDCKEYISADNCPTFILLLLSYIWAVIPFTYFFFWIFTDPNTAYIFLSSFYFLIGFIPFIITFVLDFIEDGKDRNDFYKVLFSIVPQFSLTRGLVDLNYNQMNYEIQSTLLGEHKVEFLNPLALDMVGKYIVALFGFGSVFFISFFIIECMSHQNVFLKRKLNIQVSQKRPINSDKDDDVLLEEERVHNNPGGSSVAVSNLVKSFGHKLCFSLKRVDTIMAVNDVSFGVLNEECFGLLGINGAGKTTLFKILTGDIRPTSGSVYMKGSNVTQNIKKSKNLFGYCPQFDSLCNFMNVEEHLVHFSRLRGASLEDVKLICDWAYFNLNLLAYKNTLAKHLSGGNKRKLSIALALIGNPDVVYLDEPTAGIDPNARKYVWESIVGTVKAGHSVVLTSHSLEECEFLCNRLTIMVSGELKCIGTIQHLKNKFNEGYMVEVKLAEGDESYGQFLVYITQHFPKVQINEHHLNFVKFLLPPTYDDLSSIFNVLTEAKSSLLIVDYAINQTKLEQIFWSFAKQARVSV